MKLSDINQELTEKPVGMLKRAATKLKKHTPFNADARAEAEGQDEVEAAANAVNTAFRKWLGRQSQLKDKNQIPHTLLVDFFKNINMGKTGEDVINASDAVKKSKEVDPDPDEKGQTMHKKPEGMSDLEFGQTKDAFGFESYERRLANILNEAEVDDGVAYFTKKDVEEIILQVVGGIQSSNPDGLDDWLRAKGVRQEQPSVADQAETISDEDFEIVRDEIDELVDKIQKVVKQSGVDPKKRKAVLNKINDLAGESLDQLSR